MMRQAPPPHAVFLVPSEFGNAGFNLGNVAPFVGTISQVDSDHNGRRSFSVEVELAISLD